MMHTTLIWSVSIIVYASFVIWLLAIRQVLKGRGYYSAYQSVGDAYDCFILLMASSGVLILLKTLL